MQLARSATQIVNHQARPVFAVAVGQDAVGRLRPLDADDRLSNRLHAANGLDRHGFPGVVLHFDLHGGIGALIVKLDGVDQVGLRLEPGAGDTDLTAGAQRVVNGDSAARCCG